MPDGVALWFNQVPYDAAALRQLVGGLVASGGQLLPRPGKRPGVGLEVTVGGTPESAVIQPGCCVVGDGTTTAYPVTLPAAVSKPLAARPASGQSRVDLVIVRVYDTDVHGTTALREVDVEVITGTPSAGTPTVPTLPAGALRLAQLAVPASGTVAVSNPAQRTAGPGGIIPVAGTTERAAIVSPYNGLVIYREDVDIYEGRIAGTWVPLTDSAWIPLSYKSGYSNPGFGNTPAYKILAGGDTLLSGIIGKNTGNLANSQIILSLPSGSRPNIVQYLAAQGSGSSTVPLRAEAAGDIVLNANPSAATTWVSIDGWRLRTAT